MPLTIPAVLTAAQLDECRQALMQAEWTDGRSTAGPLALRVKQNLQLPADSPVSIRLGKLILDALSRNPLFIATALPLKVMPPRFNRYQTDGHYGRHVDNAVLGLPGTHTRMRTDLSATLFLSDPGDYEGGELVIEGQDTSHRVKLPAGQLVLYPGGCVHEVTPVTRGSRLAAFFWVQSLVRDDGERAMLLSLDRAIQSLTAATTEHPALLQLTGLYHQLLRRWSDT